MATRDAAVDWRDHDDDRAHDDVDDGAFDHHVDDRSSELYAVAIARQARRQAP